MSCEEFGPSQDLKCPGYDSVQLCSVLLTGWGAEGGMLLQFCHYHIQNYPSYKQGEQANLRTNQVLSGGSGKSRSHWTRGAGLYKRVLLQLVGSRC